MEQNYPSLEQFLELPTEDVAKLVRASGAKVVVFPINGTRRWFTLEYGGQEFDNPIAAYLDIVMRRHIELYQLFFEHGIDTLLTPVIGPEILATRDAYMQKMGADGLTRLATHPELLSFYEEYDVRVRFYGEYRHHLTGTGYEHLIRLFDQITDKTKYHKTHRLFFGAFADQMRATEAVAEFAVQYYTQHGKTPDRKDIIEMYYGEYLEKANIFIGFDRFAAFDYPLLNWGDEDLYFTISPSLYMNTSQLRRILYDHLYTRRAEEVEYVALTPEETARIRTHYKSSLDNVLGVGELLDGMWLPKQIKQSDTMQ